MPWAWLGREGGISLTKAADGDFTHFWGSQKPIANLILLRKPSWSLPCPCRAVPLSLPSQSLVCVWELNCFVTLWTVDHQAPLSMGFSKQESWSGLPCPPLGDLPDPGIKLTSPASPTLQADSLPLSHQLSPESGIFPSNKGLNKYLHICFSCLNALS